MVLDKCKYMLYRLIKRRQFRNKIRIDDDSIVKQSNFEGYNSVSRNSTVMKSYVGLGTYIGDGSYISNAKIGRFCSFAENVRTALGNHPTSVFVTTHPSFYYNTESQIGFTFHKGTPIFNGLNKFPQGEDNFQVIIGNDVWIGCNCIIKGGIKIGDGAIIGAGAVVTKDVAPYSIVAGVPAKVIKYRFTEEQIIKLKKIRWWEWPIEKIKENYLSFNNIDSFINKFYENDEH